MKAEDKIAAARLAVCRRWPFLATATLSMIEVEKEAVGTMAVDAKWRLYWSREFVDSRSKSDLEFVVAHEVCHLVLGHPVRGQRVIKRPGGLEHHLWNIAADYAVNSMLEAEGMTVPKDALRPQDDGYGAELPVEEYYQHLMERTGDPGDVDPDCEPMAGGSGSDGQQRPWEESLADDPLSEPENGEDASGDGSGDDNDTPAGVSSHDAQQIVERVTEDLAKRTGKGSKSAQRLIDQAKPTKVNPRRLLAHAIRSRLQGAESGPGTSTYRRPARREPVGGVLRPKSIRPNPRVAIVVDTSGSMENSELASALGLIAQVLGVLRSTDGIRVITGDTRACTSAKVFRHDQVELAGGGGTDMGAIIDHVDAQKERVDLIICVTDGYTPWTDKKTKAPVVVALTRRNCIDDVPKWMRTVCLAS